MSPQLSIITPMYCSENYIEECIKSILKQTFQNFELLLIDDGSTDQSVILCQKHESNRVRIIKQSHQGVVSARRTGLSYATGKYIMFVDADDYLEPTCCEELVNYMEQTNADIIEFSYFAEQGEKQNKVRISDIQADYSFFCKQKMQCVPLGSVWNKIYRREVLLNSQQYWDDNIVFGEDILMVWAAIYCARKIVCCPQKYLYHYRDNENSASHRYISDMQFNNEHLLSGLKRLVWPEIFQNDWNKYLTQTCATCLYWEIINECKHRVTDS